MNYGLVRRAGPGQNEYFNANCIWRGDLARFTLPKSVPSVMLPSGFRNWVVLKRLKNSARNSIAWLSLTLVTFWIEKSKFLIPAPQQIDRFAVPSVPKAALVKPFGSNAYKSLRHGLV